MKELPIFQVDSFTDKLFSGNPAAVCLLEEWLPTAIMQSIGSENNLSETAFVVQVDEATYEIRWFTPSVEVPLCGHATLAAAYILFDFLNDDEDHEPIFHLQFRTQSKGVLHAYLQEDGRISLDLPIDSPQIVDASQDVEAIIGVKPTEVIEGDIGLLLAFENQKIIEECTPDFSAISALHTTGVLITAPGEEVDFVSRCFFPNLGVNEDPVTGAAHCLLTPYWIQRLSKDKLQAIQLSDQRGKGELTCSIHEADTVRLSGYATLYMMGKILVP